MIIVIMGPPGVGKGTYAKGLEERLGIPHISTGDLLRAAVDEGTELGLEVRKILEKGKLVPDDDMMILVSKRIQKEDAQKGFILDGFPRTVPQAEMLDRLFDKLNKKIDYIMDFFLDEAGLIQRLSNRRQCPQCGRIYNLINIKPKNDLLCDDCGIELMQRDDDHSEVIQKRLLVYKDKTQPLIHYYENRKGYLKIEAINVDDVLDEIMELIKQ
ncbi:adenylate kinase [bacterium]|nr:adenylate kinase [bacterium]